MSNLSDIERAVEELSPTERRLLMAWMDGQKEMDSCVAEPSASYGSARAERRLFTFEEYLEVERCSELRHEFVGGEIFAMSEPRQRHAMIVANIFAPVHAHLRGRPCRTYAGNRRLHFECRGDEIAYYPDVWVGCGDSRDAKGELIDDARLAIEVLSPSTARIDLREKAINFREVATLEEIVLVWQKPAKVIVYRRAEQWSSVTLESPASVLELRSIALSLPLVRLYEGLPSPA